MLDIHKFSIKIFLFSIFLAQKFCNAIQHLIELIHSLLYIINLLIYIIFSFIQ